jgi:hypothetical protein
MKKITHLDSAKEGYLEHMVHALHYFVKLSYAAISVLIHAIYPQWHQETASSIAKEIANDVDQRHSK